MTPMPLWPIRFTAAIRSNRLEKRVRGLKGFRVQTKSACPRAPAVRNPCLEIHQVTAHFQSLSQKLNFLDLGHKKQDTTSPVDQPGSPKNASIAQLVEQLICNQQVVGSSPTAGLSLKIKDLRRKTRAKFALPERPTARILPLFSENAFKEG